MVVNPNTAEVDELRGLPGIGSGLADRIIAARPYHNPEDLLQVPGLGQATLERIRTQLSFETPIELPESHEAEAEPAERSEPSWRGWWPAIAVGAVSILCSVSLTLAILLSINRTLDFGRSAELETISAQTRALQTDLSDAAIELQALRQRIEVTEGLSGRMTDVENQVSRLQERNAEMMNAVQGMQAQVSAALEETRAQAEAVSRFQGFLDGLLQLLTGDS
jgi:competence ComEA-like helix-hairpin-helix protein